MRFRKKRHILTFYLNLILSSALIVSLAGLCSAAEACNGMSGVCLTSRQASTGATLKAYNYMGEVFAIEQLPSLMAAIGPIVVNNGLPLELTGFDQQIPFSFFIKLVNNSDSSGTNWEVAASSPGIRISIPGGSILEHLILSSPLSAGVTCIAPISECSNALIFATNGDFSNPPDVVLVQTTHPQIQTSSYIFRVDSTFLLPADALSGRIATTITIAVKYPMPES